MQPHCNDFDETQSELLSFPYLPDFDTVVLPEENTGSNGNKMDVRTDLVHQLFDKYQYGNLMLYKVVRAGATTSLVWLL